MILLQRIKDLREEAPGLTLRDAKRIVEVDADQGVLNALRAVALRPPTPETRAERRERIARDVLPVVVADYLRASNEGGAYAEWKADAAAEALDIAEEFMAESDSRRAALREAGVTDDA